jgi:archaemetzincin
MDLADRASAATARRRRWTAAAPIAVVPFGPVAPRQLRLATRVLGRVFSAPTIITAEQPLPASALSTRGQYDADVLLELLHRQLPERCLRVVGVTEADLYVVGRTFVFGYAHLTDGMAVYSTARLCEGYYGRPVDASLLARRVLRTLAHEIGHTFGVPHCETDTCLMRSVSFVDTLDALPVRFCSACRPRVERGLAVAPWSARGRWERGMAWLRRRDFVRAALAFEHAVRSAPLESAYHHSLGVARLGLGDELGARRALQRATELGGGRAATSPAHDSSDAA